MRHFILHLIIVLSLQNIFAQDQNKQLIDSFNKHIPELMDQHNVVGLNIAIIENDQVSFKQSYGLANKKLNQKMSFEKGFNIGSISKIFTTWGIMKLVEQKKINLDDIVWKHVKTWQLPQSEFDANKITIRHLLQHEAGLSLHGYQGYSPEKKLPSITENLSGKNMRDQKVELVMNPGTKWQYSGGGYTILQLLIEEVTGQTFEKFMKKTVFTPLQMKNTSFTIDRKILEKTSMAYDENGKELPLYRFSAKAAAGLHTTIEDMILFAKAHWNDNPILSKSSINLLTTGSELSKGDYGLGYMIMGRFGIELAGHGGSNDGWEAGFMTNIQTKSAFIMLTNSSNGRKLMFPCLKNWVTWKKCLYD